MNIEVFHYDFAIAIAIHYINLHRIPFLCCFKGFYKHITIVCNVYCI